MAHHVTKRQLALLAAVLLTTVLSCRKQEAPPPPKAPHPLEAENLNLKKALREQREDAAAQRAYIEEVTKTINDVQDHLMGIAPIETTVRVAQQGAEGGTLEQSRRTEIIKRLEQVEARLSADANELTALQEKMAPLRVRITSLDETVTRLRQTIQRKSQEVATLKKTISKMSAHVVKLEKEHVEDQQTIEAVNVELQARTTELNEAVDRANIAYYVVGEAKALARGGYLREKRRLFRKPTYEIAEDLKADDFQQFASTREREIPVPTASKRIQLYPSRPKASYHLVTTSASASTLVIDDPSSFWAMRFVVIAID